MTIVNNNSDTGARENRSGDHHAETQPPAIPAKIREKAIRLALKSIRTGQADTESDKLTQRERVLVRICAGQGAPVMLPMIQRPGTWKFISDVAARIWELRHVFGFEIANRWWLDNGVKHSSYWIVLTDDLQPKMRPVPLLQVKDGKPEQTEQQPAPEADDRGQFSMFAADPQRAGDFNEHERGLRR